LNIGLISYISNREQYDSIDDHRTTNLLIRTGVPQGSILGPLFFMLNIDDIIYVSHNIELLLFAEDTNIFLCDTDVNQYVRANKALLDLSNSTGLSLLVMLKIVILYNSLLNQLKTSEHDVSN